MEYYVINILLIVLTIVHGQAKDTFCPGSVCICPDVFTADCSNRQLDVIPAGLPKSVKTLVLSRNNFPNLWNDTFDPIRTLNITNLMIDNCQIQNISERSFESLKSLVFIDLAYNELNIKTIYRSIQSLGNSNVQVLNISGTLFDTRLFPVKTNNIFLTAWLKGLQEIVIRACGIRFFTFDSFKELPNVRKIDFGSNLISNFVVPKVQIDTLEELNFTENYFEKIPKFCLNSTTREDIPAFPKLQKLHMAVNILMSTADFIKQGFCLQQVTILNISHNLFQEISFFSFVRMRHLQTLIIDNLRGVALDNRSLSSTSLHTLSIGRIVEIKDKEFKNIFLDCPNVTVLRIMNTDFSKTDVRKMLLPLKRLSSLTIVNGGINEMTLLNDFTNLTYIDYSFNRIKEIQGNVVQNLTNLHQFVLRSNALNNINQTFLPDLLWKKKNFLLDVSSNPLDCGCQLEWFRVWVENNIYRVIGYPKSYICQSPSDLKGKSLSNFDPASECHKVNPYIILTLISCGLLAVLIFTTVLLRKFRWDIKYYIYICRNRKPMGYKRFTDDEAYLYDAFIAYNTNDRKWIMSELVRMLERNHKFKLCLHERDIIPGGIYVDDILESIDTSRKLILVLSNNFMDDQWCKYETALASHTLADGDGHKLFLILLEDIRSEHINRSLKVLLKSISHVEWTENRTGQRIFWQAVKQFMDNN